MLNASPQLLPLGHPSIQSMERLVKDRILHDINQNEFEELSSRKCVPCIQGKQHRTPLPTTTTKATVPLERVHSNLAGPVPIRSFSFRIFCLTAAVETTNHTFQKSSKYHWQTIHTGDTPSPESANPVPGDEAPQVVAISLSPPFPSIGGVVGGE
jgi:hypothetical protein